MAETVRTKNLPLAFYSVVAASKQIFGTIHDALVFPKLPGVQEREDG